MDRRPLRDRALFTGLALVLGMALGAAALIERRERAEGARSIEKDRTTADPRVDAARPDERANVTVASDLARKSPPEVTPNDEAAHLAHVDRLRKTDPEAALAACEEGEVRFGGTGRRAEARRALRITLLVELGRMSEARAQTRAFIAAHPDSPYRRLVQGQTGVHPRPGPPPGYE